MTCKTCNRPRVDRGDGKVCTCAAEAALRAKAEAARRARADLERCAVLGEEADEADEAMEGVDWTDRPMVPDPFLAKEETRRLPAADAERLTLTLSAEQVTVLASALYQHSDAAEERHSPQKIAVMEHLLFLLESWMDREAPRP